MVLTWSVVVMAPTHMVASPARLDRLVLVS
jgi:hypothetical protein